MYDIFILSCKKKKKQTNNKKLEIGSSNDAISSFPGKQKVDPTTKKKCLVNGG
jgi:hypothetical protein